MTDRPESPAPGTRLRRLLVESGIRDPHVLEAIETTPRERFVDPSLRGAAYENRALAIGSRQTISQPFVVARMTELLELSGTSEEKVLEIGTGSGYQTAVLCRLTGRVITIERIPALAAAARALLTQLGASNVEYHTGDGSTGWPSSAPYDGIIVTAAAPRVPQTLYDQLKPGGRLVVPVGTEENQVMQQVVRGPDGPIVTDDFHCRFVPLIGIEAWRPKGPSQGD
ncbi:Protein-L-isoaspartate O-methyltransferase [Caulifigura coniformis]|uniref:Protein-L-isoaspartate O-methyltransferase n=1 Tax=Caulifigura coniformis TaxID=2527983 RepID=A0A517SCU5_9PLAN|nr:protein-L-isoaspartate(D-aspartate) O-methyltransferase [Caulifigura coniformis]QDT53947.1 Protein-L-isoaspartate O-methyltransferase [Caulifigura coniformis]